MQTLLSCRSKQSRLVYSCQGKHELLFMYNLQLLLPWRIKPAHSLFTFCWFLCYLEGESLITFKGLSEPVAQTYDRRADILSKAQTFYRRSNYPRLWRFVGDQKNYPLYTVISECGERSYWQDYRTESGRDMLLKFIDHWHYGRVKDSLTGSRTVLLIIYQGANREVRRDDRSNRHKG